MWNKTISLDDECILHQSEISSDDLGNQIENPVNKIVFCCVKRVNQSEFFGAKQEGIDSNILIYLSSFDYSEEEKLTYQGEIYSIYRRYERDDELMEVYCKKCL